MLPLVGGYVIGNESKPAHDVFNQFTKTTIEGYDTNRQTDVGDGDKGGAESFDETFEHANGFLCKNHRKINVAKHGNKDSVKEYEKAFNSNSVSSLQRRKSKFSPATATYLNKTADKKQYPAAAVAAGYEMHGVFTEQGSESQNAASLHFRMEDQALSVIKGMVEMHAKQHREHVHAAASIDDEKLVPPAVLHVGP
jgi:hypothetical protein